MAGAPSGGMPGGPAAAAPVVDLAGGLGQGAVEDTASGLGAALVGTASGVGGAGVSAAQGLGDVAVSTAGVVGDALVQTAYGLSGR